MNSNRFYKPGRVLYESIFENRPVDEIVNTISSGISLLIHNARGLLADAAILNDNNRYMVASFLAVTAREEISKVHILTDACRLDFEKHASNIRNLCRAFYSHIDKFAYFKIYSCPKIDSVRP